MNITELDNLCLWIREREAIRAKRESGLSRPWTTNKILASNHFCNVRREDDRGTKERRAAVLWHDRLISSLPWIYTASNLFNDWQSLTTVLQSNTHAEWAQALELKMSKGGKVFHVAYVVTTCGAPGSKIDYCRRVVQAVDKLAVPQTSCRAAFDTLRTVYGLGSFLAGQIVADLKNDRYLQDVVDWHSFSVMGPGSKKGLDALFGGGTNENNYEFRISALDTALPEDIKAMKIHRQDLQNCLCEFSKYHRLVNNLPGRRRPY